MQRRWVDVEKPCGVHVKGFAVLGLLKHLEQTYGAEPVAEYVASLPLTMREPLEKKLVLPVSWVPVEMYFAGVHWAIDRFHHGDPTAARALGKATASKDIGLFFKAVLGFTSPAMVLGISGRFWRSYYDRGELVVATRDKGVVHGEIRDWPLPDAVVGNELGGSFLAYLEHSRAKDVQIVSIDAPDARTLRYEIRFG